MIRMAITEEEQREAARLMFDLHTEKSKRLAKAHNFTREMYVAWACPLFSLYTVVLDARDAGVIAIGSGRIHVNVAPWAKGRWLRDLEHAVKRHLAPFGQLIAYVDADDEVANSFASRCGAVLSGNSSWVNRYVVKLDNLWFSRRRYGRHR